MTSNLNADDIYRSIDLGENTAWNCVNRRNVNELITIAIKNGNRSLELKLNVFIKLITAPQFQH
jgi:hypothetical protein